jgi:DNA-binding MarR family transcriptional regulator
MGFASPEVGPIVALLTVGSWTTTYNGWMPARPDPAQLAAWRLLLEAHAAVTELLEDELLAARGLPLSRYDVLLNLAEAPGGRLRMQELSASVLLSKSGLSRLVDRMVEAGLVRRERCQDDRRGWFAVLTDQGRAALRRAAPVHLRGVHEHFTRHLEPAEVQALTAALARVVAAARASAAAAASEEPERAEASEPTAGQAPAEGPDQPEDQEPLASTGSAAEAS